MFQPFPCKQTKKFPPGEEKCQNEKDRKPGDFGLRGFYPADAKGQYDMQVGALGEVQIGPGLVKGSDGWKWRMFFFFWGFKKRIGFTMFYLKILKPNVSTILCHE